MQGLLFRRSRWHEDTCKGSPKDCVSRCIRGPCGMNWLGRTCKVPWAADRAGVASADCCWAWIFCPALPCRICLFAIATVAATVSSIDWIASYYQISLPKPALEVFISVSRTFPLHLLHLSSSLGQNRYRVCFAGACHCPRKEHCLHRIGWSYHWYRHRCLNDLWNEENHHRQCPLLDIYCLPWSDSLLMQGSSWWFLLLSPLPHPGSVSANVVYVLPATYVVSCCCIFLLRLPLPPR